MKLIFNSQILIIAIIISWMGSINAQDHSFGVNPNPPSKTFGQMQIQDNRAVTTISQSTSMSVVTGSSVACSYGGGLTLDGNYYRSFVLSSYGITSAWNITKVTIGIESANGPDQPITCNLYTSSAPFPTGYPGSLTLIGSKTLSVPAQSLTLLDIPMMATAPAGSELVVEISSPDGWATSNGFFIGANSLGQSATGYIKSDSCGLSTPLSFAAIGFPNTHVVMSVTGTDELFFDNFDSYIAGQQLACQNPAQWTTWSNLPCNAVEDAYVSNTFAYSGANSTKIVLNNDLVRMHGAKSTGKWYISFMVYIPAGKSGYFNTMSVFSPPTYEWAMECYFDAGGSGQLLNIGLPSPVNFTWQVAAWNQVMVVIDLDSPTHQAEFWIGAGNLTQIATWDWTQGGTLPDSLAANDFFGAVATDEMYFDDYYFSDIMPPIQQLANDVGTLSIDMPTQVGPGAVIPEVTVKNYGVAANSFDVQMTITGGYTSTKTVTNLAPGTTQQVTFDNWNPAIAGAYTVNAYTQLGTDGNTSNDSLNQSIYVWDNSGDWTAGAAAPIAGIYLGSGVGYTNGAQQYVFHLAGSATVLETECFKYDVTANIWSAIASLPEGRDRFAAAGVGDYIYVIGGYDTTSAVSVYKTTVFRYDIVGNSWSTVAPLPVAIGWGRAVGYNNRIYFAGGYDGVDYLSTVYVYDVTGNTWGTATSMPDGVFGGGFSVAGNKLVYAAGAGPAGISNTVYVGTIDAGNPLLISWTTMENTYPGINKQVVSHGTDLTGLMNPGGRTNHSPDAVTYPAGAMYRFEAEPWGTDAIIVAGGSPTSTWVASNPNPCYIYKPSTDSWVAQENVPVPITAASTGVVNDGGIWKLVLVGGINNVGALTNGTQIYTQTISANTFPLTVNMLNGWNMVSIPGLHPTNQNVTTWWPGKDPTAGVFKFQGGYQPITAAVPGIGYWMKNVGAQVYNTGDEWPAGGINIVAHDPIAGLTGWNLFGGYEQSVPVANVTTTPGGLQTGSIFKYTGGYTAATTLEPGYGYWIKLTGAGQINIGAGTAGPSKIAVPSTEDFGKITITDNAQKSYTLYAVEGEADLTQFDLPPYPPQGMFDVRYSSQRYAENLSIQQGIEMTGVQYPVKVKAVGTDIILSDETGKEIARLKTGEEVTLNTAGKLFVTGNVIPTVYSLEQNYPNPFNPSTMIQFSIPEDVQNVKLIIYSALGEKVAELVNTGLQAGTYKYNWNASDVSSGLYIYQVVTEKFVSTKKMMLLK